MSNLTQTITDKIELAKLKTQERYFREFCQCKTDDERHEVGAKMDVLRSVVLNLTKVIKEVTE